MSKKISELTEATIINADDLMVIVQEGETKRAIVSLLGTGGGGGGTYTNLTPTPTTVGGISAGSTFEAKDFSEMWDALLYPYQNPSFTSFTIVGFGTKEVGDLYSAGSKTFNWSTSNSANVKVDSVKIEDITNGVLLGDTLANDGSEALTTVEYRKLSAATHTWRISAQNTKDANFSRNFSISWQWRAWWGESALASLSESDVKALRATSLRSGANGDYAMSAGGYKYWAFPTSFGLKTTWKDIDTGFDVAMSASPQTISITNDFGITTDYYVYRTFNTLGGSINVRIS